MAYVGRPYGEGAYGSLAYGEWDTVFAAGRAAASAGARVSYVQRERSGAGEAGAQSSALASYVQRSRKGAGRVAAQSAVAGFASRSRAAVGRVQAASYVLSPVIVRLRISASMLNGASAARSGDLERTRGVAAGAAVTGAAQAHLRYQWEQTAPCAPVWGSLTPCASSWAEVAPCAPAWTVQLTCTE